ncbi:hypothetical protein SAMN05216317_13116, partial [Nitrosomonas eutropha]
PLDETDEALLVPNVVAISLSSFTPHFVKTSNKN